MSHFRFTQSAAFLACAFVLVACNHFNPDNGPIRLNQVGFAPDQEKTATVVISNIKVPISNCYITNIAGDTVWRGEASETMLNPVSGKPCQIVDFSDLTACGEYTLYVENDQMSNLQFQISNSPYRELTRQALRAYYHQRASMATEEPYAEGFARPAGHPDDHVLVHASAATDERPAGTVISSPGGWYDAGDYNKYIVNSGYTMGVWLMAYELNKAYFDTLRLNIPESSIAYLPDMLAEAMYNLRWMLTMQDTDGGVYHKLTEPDFESFIAPDQCRKPRYVVMKTTAATQQATEAAKRAYAWALEHPDVYYDQDAMNAQFKPEITTGAYPDTCVADEFYWAKTELYLLTKEPEYNENPHSTFVYKPAAWGDVAELADLEWMMHPDEGGHFSIVREAQLLAYLKQDLKDAETISVHRCPYGNCENDFFWGCNSEGCCWRGVECLYAYRLTGDEQYRINAERCLNYILGQNATGYCYVTGFGSRPTSHPHHRLSYTNPHGTIPGFLAGGPNPAQQDRITDGVKYPKNVPADESYLDFQPSYASNEVTIIDALE